MEPIALPWNGRPRRYWLASPVSAGAPLVVMLHGTGGTALLAIEETGLAEFAGRAGFAVAFPEGLAVNPDSPSRFLSNPQRWNDGSTRAGHRLHTDHDDVGFLAAVIGDATRRANADPDRVFLTGFSNGASMAFRFAAERADLIRAVAPIAGYNWTANPTPVRPIPTLFMIGDSDPLIPLHGGEVQLPWFPKPVVRPGIYPGLADWEKGLGSEKLQTMIIPGLGHHWPGGKGLLNPRIGGTPSDAVNANERVWEFFRGVASIGK